MYVRKFSVERSILVKNVASVTDWPSEWQTEPASKVNVINMEIFLLDKESSITVLFWMIWGKQRNASDRVSEWLSDWMTKCESDCGTTTFIEELRF